MNMLFNEIGVDAGIIMICDEEYYKKYGFKFEDNLSQRRKIKPGTYNCKWFIKKTWNGNVRGEGELKITSGNMIVSDPCYCIESDNWMDFLEATKYGENPEKGTVIIDKTGGDGTFNVSLNLSKIYDGGIK